MNRRRKIGFLLIVLSIFLSSSSYLFLGEKKEDVEYKILTSEEKYLSVEDKLNLDTSITLKYVTNHISGKITILANVGDVNFDTGDSSLTTRAENSLREFISFLNGNYTISIEGHTDKPGSEETNYYLSLGRAKKVEQFLRNIKDIGLDLTSTGYGESKPKVDTEAACYINRRVEIIITEKDEEEKKDPNPKRAPDPNPDSDIDKPEVINKEIQDWLQILANIAAIISAITGIIMLFLK